MLKAYLALLLVVSSTSFADWIEMTVNKEDTPVYSDADRDSEIVGYYPAGKHLQIYLTDKEDFYRLYFVLPDQKEKAVWIEKAALIPSIDPTVGPDLITGEPREFSPPLENWVALQRKRYWISLGGGAQEIPENITQPGGAFFYFPNFQMEQGYAFNSTVQISLRFLQSSFTSALGNKTYSFTGSAFLFNLFLPLYSWRQTRLQWGAGAGFSINSMGVQNNSGISWPIRSQIRLSELLSTHFTLTQELGYTLHSASTPYTATYRLSGFFMSMDVGYWF